MRKFFYDLRYHDLGDWSLHRWFVTLLLFGALVVAWIGRRQLVGVYGLAAVLLILAAVALVLIHRRAAAQGYIEFRPDAEARRPQPAALSPDDEVLLYASGAFEVQVKTRYFAALPARFSTFATREHAIIGRVVPTRALLVGTMPPKLVGMWYIFFRPENVHAIEPGVFVFGELSLPALRVTYDLPLQPERKGRAAGPQRTEAYLAFEDDAARASVWADLLAD